MAAVDSLLQIAHDQKAEGLVLASGEAPLLEIGGGKRHLSMPPLTLGMLSMFLDEIGGGEGATSFEHECSSGSYSVRVETGPDSLRLVFDGRDTVDKAPREESVAPAPVESASPRDTQPRSGVLIALLGRATRAGASDLIASVGQAPRVRIDGVLQGTNAPLLRDEDFQELLAQVGEREKRALQERGSCDFSMQLAGGERFRINVFEHGGGLALAARPVRRDVPTLRGLRLPEELSRLAELKNGLVLLAGPTGSGKSTTAVALVEHLNRTQRKHIITIEDPVEYLYESKRSLIHQREVGRDVPSYELGLSAALRESPDVIVVGEMRDSATIAAALTAAELGHLVISTIHSRGAAWALNRIVDGVPADKRAMVAAQLGNSLRAVVTQVLVPTLAGGRRAAHEVLMVNEAVAQKLRERQVHQIPGMIETGQSSGMRTLERSLATLVRDGIVDAEEAISVTTQPKTLEQLLRRG